MEIKDFRKLVSDSPIKDKLNSFQLTLKYPHLNSNVELKGIQAIYKFVYNQVVGFNHIENLPEYFSHSKKYFEELKPRLISLVLDYNENYDSQFDYNWSQLVDSLKKYKVNNRYDVFLYDSPETDFIISINAKNKAYTQSAIDFITNNITNFNNSTDNFTGALLAYEFKHQADSEILQRRNNEKISLSAIRSKYNEYIVEAEQQLNANIEDAKENLTNHFESVTLLKEEKKADFDFWFSTSSEQFNTFFKTAQESFTTNEDLYRDKLRLEAPAQFWHNRANKLKNEGRSYLAWLVGISLVAAILLFTLLYALGNDYFKIAFSNTAIGIKWSIILITMVSLIAFTIKILAKLTFSSFHLSRDAEEREQLTHFYLALKKDTTIEPEERQLILQSLFSRADTGLLKEDSSPTMPSSFLEKISSVK